MTSQSDTFPHILSKNRFSKGKTHHFVPGNTATISDAFMGAFHSTAEQMGKAFVTFITRPTTTSETHQLQSQVPDLSRARTLTRCGCFQPKTQPKRKKKAERSWDWRLVRAVINESATSWSSRSMREVRREAAMRIILISRTVVVSAPTLLSPALGFVR